MPRKSMPTALPNSGIETDAGEFEERHSQVSQDRARHGPSWSL